MKICATTLSWRQVESEHMRSVLKLIRHPAVSRFAQPHGDALVTRARAVAASRFLDTDCDVMLMLDSDIVFGVAEAVDICHQAMEKDIVGGLYLCRSMDAPKPASVLGLGPTVFLSDNREPVPALWVAGGFMAVHRRVFEELRKDLPLCHPSSYRFWPFFDPMVVEQDGELIYLSEDFAFCERARRAGFGVWLNPAVNLGHIGTHVYRLRDLARLSTPVGPIRIERTEGNRYVIETPDPVAQAAG